MENAFLLLYIKINHFPMSTAQMKFLLRNQPVHFLYAYLL